MARHGGIGAVAAALVVVALVLARPAPAAACQTVDPPHDWSFADGLVVAVRGTVISTRDDHRLVNPRLEVVLQVEQTFTGPHDTIFTLRRGGPGCDSIEGYDIGDELILASGYPGAPDFMAEPPTPPWNHYNAGVWEVDTRGRLSGPTLAGRQVTTSDELIALLESLPDTAVARSIALTPLGGALLVLAGAWILIRGPLPRSAFRA